MHTPCSSLKTYLNYQNSDTSIKKTYENSDALDKLSENIHLSMEMLNRIHDFGVMDAICMVVQARETKVWKSSKILGYFRQTRPEYPKQAGSDIFIPKA